MGASWQARRAGCCGGCSAPERLRDVAEAGRHRVPPPAVGADAEAAVLFTSGATGPAKGVVYRHGQLQAQLETLRATYG